MWSACGVSPSGALASSAARWRTPKRCCSSTTHRARSRNSTGSSISAWVPTSSWSWPEPSAPSRSRRRAAGVEPVSSSSGSAPPSRRSSVRWCCSARVSVGAISAAWAPFSTARSIACSATTVLPAPTSPISRRCIGRSRARSSSISLMALFWSPVSSKGSDQRQRSTTTPRAASGRAWRPWRRARRLPATASWSSSSSSKASRRRAPRSSSSLSGKCAPASAAARSGSRSATRIPAGSGSGVSRKHPRASQTSERRRAALSPSVAGCTGTRPTVWTGASPPPSGSCSDTQNSPARRRRP